MSKLEESLAQILDFASRNENAPWPYPPPIREFHPMWCCEHRKGEHRWALDGEGNDMLSEPLCWACIEPWLCVREMTWDDARERSFHAFAHERDFRVDFAWPAQRVIVECEGIRYDKQGGRHQTGPGFANDLEKYSALELAGWRVIRVSQREITSGIALELIEKALKERELEATRGD